MARERTERGVVRSARPFTILVNTAGHVIPLALAPRGCYSLTLDRSPFSRDSRPRVRTLTWAIRSLDVSHISPHRLRRKSSCRATMRDEARRRRSHERLYLLHFDIPLQARETARLHSDHYTPCTTVKTAARVNRWLDGRRSVANAFTGRSKCIATSIVARCGFGQRKASESVLHLRIYMN